MHVRSPTGSGATFGRLCRKGLSAGDPYSLTQREASIPDALAAAIGTLRSDLAKNLRTVDLVTGWTPAYSLDESEAAHTAEFLIYSALTTVARRPDTTWSWTENWPYEPEVGNTPTTNTFIWTWASFCFTFLAFGAVLFIYERYLSDPDQAPMDPVLVTFRPSARPPGPLKHPRAGLLHVFTRLD